MKPVQCLLVLLVTFFICQPQAMAGTDIVMVYAKTGEPMIVRNFYLGWSDVLHAEWNKQQIEVPIKNIKSIRLINSQADEGDNANVLDVDVTLKSGEKSHMKIKNAICTGETQFGKLKLAMADIASLDFEPDLNRPEADRTSPAQMLEESEPSVGKP